MNRYHENYRAMVSRLTIKFSQSALARALGVSQPLISGWLNGRRQINIELWDAIEALHNETMQSENSNKISKITLAK